MPENMIHLNNKYTLNKGDFVPWVSAAVPTVKRTSMKCLHPITGDYASLTPMTSLLLNADYPEAYFALGKTQSSIDTYSMVQLLNAKQYDEVTPHIQGSMGRACEHRPAYKILSETEEALEEDACDEPCFSEEVQSLMGGDE